MTVPAAPPAAPDGAPAPARRRRFRWRWLFLALLSAPLLLSLALALLLPDRRLERLLADELSRQLGASVSLRLDRRGLGSWTIDSLTIAGDEGRPPFLRLDRLRLRARPSTLLDRRLSLDSLVLEGLELGLVWNDGLDLPAWLDSLLSAAPDSAAAAAAAAEPDSTADGSPFAWLRPLASAGLTVDSTRFVLRGARLRLQGTDEDRRVDLASPPLDVSLRLPRLEEADLAELADGRLPSRLLAGALLGWTGAWSDAAWRAGEGLRPLPMPPALRATFAEAELGVGLKERLAQNLDAELTLAADTLRLEGRAALSPSELDLLFEGAPLPLPASFESRLQLDWPLRAPELRLEGRLDWALSGPGLAADGGVGFALSRPDSLWLVRGRLGQRASGERIGPWLPPALAGEGLDGAASFDFGVDFELRLDEGFAPLSGELDERLELSLPRLRWAAMGVELDSLRLEQRLRAGLLAAADGLWPRDPRLEASLSLASAVYADSSGRWPARGVSGALTLTGGGPADSLELAADLGLEEALGARLDGSAGGRLPGPRRLAELAGLWAEAPERVLEQPLWFALESGRLPLDPWDPDLRGHLRLSIFAASADGALALEGEGIPDRLAYLYDGDTLAIPLHRLGFAGSLRPLRRADGSWAATTEGFRLEPDPLGPLTFALREEAGRARLLADWPALRVERLLQLTPPALLPEDLPPFSASLDLSLDAALDAAWWPDSLALDLDLRDGATVYEGYAADTLSLAARLDWAADSLRFAGAGRVERVTQEDPAWSWADFAFDFAGGLLLPEDSLLADPTGWLERPDGSASMALSATLRGEPLGFGLDLELAGPDWRDPLGLGGRLDGRLDTPGPVEPWPGLVLGADLGWKIGVEARGGGEVLVEGRLDGGVERLVWEKTARLEGLRLELPFRQELTWNLDGGVLWPAPEGRPPLDWNALRAMDRDKPPAAIGAAAALRRGTVRGWALRIDHLAWETFEVHEFVADLRLADGRLDCPEFRLQAFAGDLKGAFRVAGFDDPAYAFDLACVGLDSRNFRFGREAPAEKAVAAGRRGSRTGDKVRLDAQLHLEGRGADLSAVDRLEGRLRMPALGREVTLNLLIALDARGVDPSIGRVRRLLELPGFKYRVDALDFTFAHGFVRPQVELRKSPFSPLPDVTVPMSPLPLGFLVKNFALSEEETP